MLRFLQDPDRVTPGTTSAMLAETEAALELRDEAAVWTEPFWQWVVEDRFVTRRPISAPPAFRS
ncbi:hypothetical protein [Sphingomonas profundi]|uniref:hypothetical protein n=1 Tax=Alterirhizorhabdus profundi TaxID=2681549 RepID=UPI0012E7C166|nr:hypothetical protein [Sphingomonas profundi]